MLKNHFNNLVILFLVALIFHGALLPFTHSSTYDAYIHMFFGDHYNKSWFDPWEPRWYTGFSTTSYPPATHMLMGLLNHLFPLRASFVIAMLMGMLTLVLGFYRFSNIWMRIETSFIATLLLIFASSIAETIHIFGQLPTIFSLGIFLNAMPSIYRWLVSGRVKSLIGAIFVTAAATSAHHVTTIFGSVFFIGSLALYSWLIYLNVNNLKFNWKIKSLWRISLPVWRGLLLAILMIAAIIITVFPYWYWSVTDPITQVSIPHGSRENYILRPELGLVFFLIPWGLSLLFLPYVAYKGLTTRLWPFAGALFLAFILGTGGTTPISKFLLRGAFDILTLDRFTFWASILALPFVGLFIEGLIWGRSGRLMREAFGKIGALFPAGIIVSYSLLAVLIGTQSSYKNLQPEAIDPTPIVQFMSTDEHDKWRYLTLGFGDQFAYISSQMNALSIDGNYHSARRLPQFTRYSVERLENAKYLGIGGIGSLQQFLINANRYHLKYIFSNDAFYDPLLYATGWNYIIRLPNNIVVWEKPGVRPLPSVLPRKNIPHFHKLMWGILPPTAFIIGFVFILLAARRMMQNYNRQTVRHSPPALPEYLHPTLLRKIARMIGMLILILALIIALFFSQRRYGPASPRQIVENYLLALDFRDFETAYSQLDPDMRPDFREFHFSQIWSGGLIGSFAKLSELKTTSNNVDENIIDVTANIKWLTALGYTDEIREFRTIKTNGRWHIIPQIIQPVQSAERIQRREQVDFNVIGRRQPLFDPDLHRDLLDRPEFVVGHTRLVEYEGRYSIIGAITNRDVDPLSLDLLGELYDEENTFLLDNSGGLATPFRLLPFETSGFRVDFEGILKINDAKKYSGFDPDIYIPPTLPSKPVTANLKAKSLATENGLYRDYTLARITSHQEEDEIIISGNIINNGLESISVAKLLASFYDQKGELRWVSHAFSQMILRPGQIVPFTIRAPFAENINIISEIEDHNVQINLNQENEILTIPSFDKGSIPLNGMAGFSAMRIYLDPMLYDEKF